MQILIDNLKKNNLKITPQRLLIYSYLYNNQSHPTAETIYYDIKKDNPTISFATVYKTLKSLKNAFLINELNLGEDSFRYDANTSSHSHIICTNCKKIIDFNHNKLYIDNIKDEFLKQNDFHFLSEQIFFYGLCNTCQQ